MLALRMSYEVATAHIKYQKRWEVETDAMMYLFLTWMGLLRPERDWVPMLHVTGRLGADAARDRKTGCRCCT